MIMPKQFMKKTLILVFLSSLLGCGVAKDISVRSYKQDKKRVDQTVGGAVGNWENAPQAVSTQNKETRKVYFLEFSKEPVSEPNLSYLTNDGQKESADLPVEKTPTSNSSSSNFANKSHSQEDSSNVKRKIEIPDFDETSDEKSYRRESSSSMNADQKFVDYTVDKNDTLQKISMKFYNSYSKWPRIYEANKDVLKSPDILKPGVNLKIPVD